MPLAAANPAQFQPLLKYKMKSYKHAHIEAPQLDSARHKK